MIKKTSPAFSGALQVKNCVDNFNAPATAELSKYKRTETNITKINKVNMYINKKDIFDCSDQHISQIKSIIK